MQKDPKKTPTLTPPLDQFDQTNKKSDRKSIERPMFQRNSHQKLQKKTQAINDPPK